jgi:hypothetical protein
MVTRIDFNELQALIVNNLPHRVRWYVGGTPLDFDFSPERFGLRQASVGGFAGDVVPDEWSEYRLFGAYTYGQGGGASPLLAIRERDGFVCGLDVERKGRTVFLFNSSLPRFVRTFELFDRHLRIEQSLPSAVALQAQTLDPDVFEFSEWRESFDSLSPQTNQKRAYS